MRNALLTLAALAISVTTAKAQQAARRVQRPSSSTATASASIEGDVYLLTQSGDVKKGAANTVYLVPDPDPRGVLSDSACQERRDLAVKVDAGEKLNEMNLRLARISPKQDVIDMTRENASVTAERRVLLDAMRRHAGEDLVLASKATSSTGMNAHYRFAGVRPGRYVLYAETVLGDNQYQWLKAVALRPGEHASHDLDNAAVSPGRNFCVQR